MAQKDRSGFEQLGETLGGAAGRMAGRATDAAMDVAGGLFGNAMEALGDWFGTDEARRAGGSFGADDDREARLHFEARSGGGEGAGASKYDEVRPLYQFGHVAAHNPDYAGRSFREVEPQLERAWREDQSTRYGDWPRVRDYVGHGFERRAETLRETREAGMRAQGGGSSAEAEIRVSSRDGMS